MTISVLDASALLAFLLDEPGGDLVETYLPQSIISAVNWSEVLQKMQRYGADTTGTGADLEALGVGFMPFEAIDAELSASIWKQGQPYGLSLGDRACLALGMRLHISIITADKVWLEAYPNLDIQLIR